jgi:putative membrane protein
MYLWLKVIHLLAVMSWMAGLFYLPRLFVYHADKAVGGEVDLTFLVMERRLLKAIMRPAAAVVAASGAGLVYVLSLSLWESWLLLKLVCVAGMFVFHGMLERHARDFKAGLRSRSSRYFRIINEVPTLLLIAIVTFVVVRPFA